MLVEPAGAGPGKKIPLPVRRQAALAARAKGVEPPAGRFAIHQRWYFGTIFSCRDGKMCGDLSRFDGVLRVLARFAPAPPGLP